MSDQTITLPRGEFAAYQKAVELGKAECARLTTERDAALASRDQALRAVEAERSARERADAVVRATQDYRAAVDSLNGIDVAERRLLAALTTYEQPDELFPPPADESPAERQAIRAIGLVKRMRTGEE